MIAPSRSAELPSRDRLVVFPGLEVGVLEAEPQQEGVALPDAAVHDARLAGDGRKQVFAAGELAGSRAHQRQVQRLFQAPYREACRF